MVLTDIKFSCWVITKELLAFLCPLTSRNVQCENFYCQWELAQTNWFDMTTSTFIPFLQKSTYRALNSAQGRKINRGTERASTVPGFLHHQARELLSYVNTTLLCWFVSTTRIGHKKTPQNNKPKPLLDLANHYRFWMEFQAVNSLILLKQVLSALGHSSADTSKVLMSRLNRQDWPKKKTFWQSWHSKWAEHGSDKTRKTR